MGRQNSSWEPFPKTLYENTKKEKKTMYIKLLSENVGHENPQHLDKPNLPNLPTSLRALSLSSPLEDHWIPTFSPSRAIKGIYSKVTERENKSGQRVLPKKGRVLLLNNRYKKRSPWGLGPQSLSHGPPRLHTIT